MVTRNAFATATVPQRNWIATRRLCERTVGDGVEKARVTERLVVKR